MGAMTLLVDRHGAELSLSKSAPIVHLRYPDGEHHRVGLYALQRILIYGDMNLPTALVRAADAAAVNIVLLPRRSKGNTVHLFPHVNSQFKLRLAQHRAYFDEKVRLSVAQKMVEAKIQAQAFWLSHHKYSCDFSKALAEVQRAPNNASLMGIEGSTSQKYLAGWRTLWNETWGFKERNRRPPLDPVNALLSLSYTMAGNSVGQLLSTYGLDVGLGFLHVPQSNRPSLALDVLEPVRPWVDQWLWQQIQEGLLTPKQFGNTKELGCRLDKAGREAFFPAWYDKAEPWLQTPMRNSLALLLKILRQHIEAVE